MSPYLPSWLHDFTTGSLDLYDIGEESFCFASVAFRASGSSHTLIRRTGLQKLNVAAFFIDEIQVLGFMCPKECGELCLGLIWLHWINEVHENVPNASDVPKRVLRTACIDIGDNDRRWCMSDMEVMSDILSLIDLTSLDGIRVDDRSRIYDEVKRLSSKWFMHLRKLALRKRFFITQTGHLLLAPLDATAGDSVAIFASGDMPFVVRRVKTKTSVEDEHRLIGACYLEAKLYLRA